ncbi:hypothetical protein Tco_0587449 [Tanacetum coccineum]
MLPCVAVVDLKSAKRHQILELEKMWMNFQRELELQNKVIEVTGIDPPVSNVGKKHVLDQTEVSETGQEVCESSSGFQNQERVSQQNQISSHVHPESNADRVVATNGAAPESLDIEPAPATFGSSETPPAQKRGCTQSTPGRGKRGPTYSASGAQPSNSLLILCAKLIVMRKEGACAIHLKLEMAVTRLQEFKTGSCIAAATQMHIYGRLMHSKEAEALHRLANGLIQWAVALHRQAQALNRKAKALHLLK